MRTPDSSKRLQPRPSTSVGMTSLSSLTTLSAHKSQPPQTSMVGNVAAPRLNGATNPQTFMNGSRFVHGVPMSIMGRARSVGGGNVASSDIHSAAATGDETRVTEHVRSGADINFRDGRQWSLLHHACFHGHLGVVRVLLRAGADKEVRTAIGLTPLCLACQNGHKDVAEELFAGGVSVGGGGLTPASTGCVDEIVGRDEFIPSANPTLAPAPAPMALFIAAREGHLDLVHLLLTKGGVEEAARPGPDGKLAGDVFGKGVDEDTRAHIRVLLEEARARVKHEIVATTRSIEEKRNQNNTSAGWSLTGGGRETTVGAGISAVTLAPPMAILPATSSAERSNNPLVIPGQAMGQGQGQGGASCRVGAGAGSGSGRVGGGGLRGLVGIGLPTTCEAVDREGTHLGTESFDQTEAQ
ncbi:unnamed protein product [Choristocarpus tenellus]